MSNAACFCRFPQHHCPAKTACLMRPIALYRPHVATYGKTTPSRGLFPTTFAFSTAEYRRFPQKQRVEFSTVAVSEGPQRDAACFWTEHYCPQHSPRRFQLVKKQRAGVSMDLLATILAPKKRLVFGSAMDFRSFAPFTRAAFTAAPPHPLFKHMLSSLSSTLFLLSPPLYL